MLPYAAAGVIAVVTVAGLVAVWLSPRHADLESFVEAYPKFSLKKYSPTAAR